MSTEEILIDLSSTGSFENMLFELTGIIERTGLNNKAIKINFGDLSLTQSMLTNLQTVLKGFDIETKMVYSTSIQTKLAALDTGLVVSGEELKQQDSSSQMTEDESAGEKLVSAIDKAFEASQEIVKDTTLYIKQTLRSGQKVEHDGNIVIIGDCKAGSEIIATGDITVWGILGGIAHAGSQGNYNAAIRAFRINAIQLRIADLLARKPDTVEFEKADKQNQFTPEEARITEGEIVIYSLYSA
jgi:septum site-determining protein MinC